MKEKIGIGILTCNREEMFFKCISSIPDVDEIIVINDGNPYKNTIYGNKPREVLQHKKNRGIGISKNEALSYLLQNNCKHIFLCEDDLRINNPEIIKKYIYASEKTGLYHLNYGYHGPNNKNNEGKSNPRKIAYYDNGVRIALNRFIIGAFSYYRDDIIKDVGYMDSRYKNAWEHVDHTFEIIKAGYHPPFWWFPDVAESDSFIEDLDPSLNKSIIRKKYLAFRIRFKIYTLYYKKKHGHKPWEVPDTSEEDVLKVLAEIQRKYGENKSDLPRFENYI